MGFRGVCGENVLSQPGHQSSCVIGGRSTEAQPLSKSLAVIAPRMALPIVGLQRLGRCTQLQGQILDNSRWKIMEITGKSGFELEGLQEEGKAELPPGRFVRQEYLLLSR